MNRQSRHLLRSVVRYRGRFLAGLSCVVLSGAVGLAAPWVLKLAIDDLILGVTRAKLAFYAFLILGIVAFGGLFQFLKRRVIIGISRDIEFDLRNWFFAHLQRLPLGFYTAHRTGDLMSRAINDLSAVRQMVGPAVMYASSTGLTFVAALTMMLTINARLTLIALVPLPFVTLSARYFGRAIHERFERIQAQLSDMSAVTQEALAGVRVIRAYRQEVQELDRFRDANQEYVERNRGLIRLQGLFFPTMGLLMGCSELLVLWLGSRDVVAGRMSVGELVAFNAYLVSLAWPMIAFGWVTNLLQRGRASWGRMLAILDAEPAIVDVPHARHGIRVEDIRGDIEVRHLEFRYPAAGSDASPAISDVSVTIPAGQTVAIVGRTGSGKSTLLSLLPRLYDPPPRTLFIDGIDVRELPLATLRGAIGMVPQEPFLFSDTIAENVAFGASKVPGFQGSRVPKFQVPALHLPDPPALQSVDRELRRASQPHPPEIAHVAAIARLDKDLPDFPDGYNTRIGERGITLSGGQKQRVALARALYVNPRILVLDDALSAVDTQTEEEILRGLREFMRDRTALIVSHRISTVRDADLILVLDEGRVVERGTHDELLSRDGVYAELHRHQLLENELAAS